MENINLKKFNLIYLCIFLFIISCNKEIENKNTNNNRNKNINKQNTATIKSNINKNTFIEDLHHIVKNSEIDVYQANLIALNLKASFNKYSKLNYIKLLSELEKSKENKDILELNSFLKNLSDMDKIASNAGSDAGYRYPVINTPDNINPQFKKLKQKFYDYLLSEKSLLPEFKNLNQIVSQANKNIFNPFLDEYEVYESNIFSDPLALLTIVDEVVSEPYIINLDTKEKFKIVSPRKDKGIIMNLTWMLALSSMGEGYSGKLHALGFTFKTPKNLNVAYKFNNFLCFHQTLSQSKDKKTYLIDKEYRIPCPIEVKEISKSISNNSNKEDSVPEKENNSSNNVESIPGLQDAELLSICKSGCTAYGDVGSVTYNSCVYCCTHDCEKP